MRKMPKKRPTVVVNLPITVRLDVDNERFSSGNMHMSIADVCVTVSRDGVEVGRLAAAIGGGMEFQTKHRHWFLTSPELLLIFETAEAQYLDARQTEREK